MIRATPDGISRADWRVGDARPAPGRSQAPVPPAKANALRFAVGLALLAVCAPLPAFGQYFPPPLIIVPPPAQDYAAPKPAPKPPPSGKPAPATDAPQTSRPKGHYEGRTFVPD